MDIGRASMMTNTSSIQAAGSFTELTYSVPSRLKDSTWLFGLYLVKGAELLHKLRRFLFVATHDEGCF